MKSILHNILNKYDNIFVHKYKVDSCYVEEIKDERGQYKIDICYIEDNEAVCQKYDYVFMTIGTLPYKDPYKLKRCERIYRITLSNCTIFERR